MAISRFLRRLSPAPALVTPPRPARPVIVLGDVHGRADLLEQILPRLAALPEAATSRLVVAGDMIDRGPDSAAVLARLRALVARPAPFAEVICLMGNHERMMLDFLRHPGRAGPRWLVNGGEATLRSFGLDPSRAEVRASDPPSATDTGTVTSPHRAKDRLSALRDQLAAALPDGLEEWLFGLPLLWREGLLAVTHAGADPGRPLPAQTEQTLLWGHRLFHHQTRQDGIWIAHGHVIVDRPTAKDGRIATDTGACHTNRLTAAVIGAEGVEFMTTA